MIWLEKVSVQNQNPKIKTLKNKLSMQKKKKTLRLLAKGVIRRC